MLRKINHRTQNQTPVMLSQPQGPPLVLSISGIAYRAGRVEPGFLFACLERTFVPELQGEDICSKYIALAVERGASALLVSEQTVVKGTGNMPLIRVPNVAKAAAELAAQFYGYPMEKLQVIGITGTNGKTSVAHMLRHIFNQAKGNAASLGTLGIQSPYHTKEPGHFTTPPAPDLQQSAAELWARGIQTLVMESTSHGLALFRDWGTEYDLAIFTNFSQDHLDLHHTMEAYLATKLSLFAKLEKQKRKSAPVAVINGDDPYAQRFIKACGKARVLTYGTIKEAHVQATEIGQNDQGLHLKVRFPAGQCTLHLPLFGNFNAANALAAFSAALAMGLNPRDIAAALTSLPPVAGRFQMIETRVCRAVVDFAHTPDSLEKTLTTARSLCRGRLWVVFGCGGNRDPHKRPLMGKIAACLSDRVVITSDNPRDEVPERIIDHILRGIPTTHLSKVSCIQDRRKAILHALSQADPEDMVIVAGKGHETVQIVGKKRIPFNDAAILAEFPMNLPVGSDGRTALQSAWE